MNIYENAAKCLPCVRPRNRYVTLFWAGPQSPGLSNQPAQQPNAFPVLGHETDMLPSPGRVLIALGSPSGHALMPCYLHSGLPELKQGAWLTGLVLSQRCAQCMCLYYI